MNTEYIEQNGRQPYEFSLRERIEDVIEYLYLEQRAGHTVTAGQVCEEKAMTRAEYRRIRDFLHAHGYLEETDSRFLILTEYGLLQAQSISERHHYLSSFFQYICNVDEQTADQNACRIEHVVSDEILKGIVDFMRCDGHETRSFCGQNPNIFYDEGNYFFPASIYQAGARFPRILSKENGKLEPNAVLYVGNTSYIHLIPKDPALLARHRLWVMRDGSWQETERAEEAYRISAEAFTYTKIGGYPCIEAEAVIALVESDREPNEDDMRELNIHCW